MQMFRIYCYSLLIHGRPEIDVSTSGRVVTIYLYASDGLEASQFQLCPEQVNCDVHKTLPHRVDTNINAQLKT